MTFDLLKTMHGRVLIGLVAAVATATPDIAVSEVSVPQVVSTLKLGHGTRLTDEEGFTLYQYENDLRTPGASTCNDECAEKYPPLIATKAPDPLPKNWSLIKRDDGSMQWAYMNLPVYRSVADSYAGTAFGEGGGWVTAFVPLAIPPEISIQNTVIGHVLASSNKKTLYAAENSSVADSQECDRACMEIWPPVEAPSTAFSFGDFSIYARDNGINQWAHKGRPLHQYAGDSQPGDLLGQGADGVWTAVVVQPAPPNPDWVTVVGSDGGQLYANADGLTLYTLYVDRNLSRQAYAGSAFCDKECLEREWIAVEAKEMLQPIGNWSVVEKEDQTLQWTYLGMPIYISKLEDEPGQLVGTTRRSHQWFKPIMYSLPALQGVLY